jgi:hypothetical protein
VIARRFGDCKDKSLLLVTLMRLIGIDAVPVLVSSSDRAAVQQRLPSPYDFDHVIVRAELEGRPTWIDSTASYQRGPLVSRPAPPFAVALPIAARVTAPETIVDQQLQQVPDTHVHESFEIDDVDGGARLQIVTRYRAAEANSRRADLATGSRDELQKSYLKFYTGLYGRMRVAQPLQVHDDEARNEIETRESYALDALWQDGANFQFWSVSSLLVRPDKVAPRLAPFALKHPAHVLHQIQVQLPLDFEIEEEDTRSHGPGVESHHQVRYDNRRLLLRLEYRTLASQVRVEDLPAYDKAAERIENTIGYEVFEGRSRGDRYFGLKVLLGTLVFAGGVILAVSLPRMRRAVRTLGRRRRFKRASVGSVGETPDKALRIESLDAIDRHMTALSCSCMDRPHLQIQRAPTKVRYMGAEIWHQTAQCSGCSQRVTRYFMLEAP